jgi:DNA-binding CsgD family transcriptional regulator
MSTLNPFTFGNPITDARRFVGRQREVAQLFSRLRNVEFESSSLVGERRVGKTSLLYTIADREVQRSHGLDPDKYIFVYADLALIDATTTPARLWQYLLGQMLSHLPAEERSHLQAALDEPSRLDHLALAEWFDRLDARQHRVVLLLDEFENVTRNGNFGPDFFYGMRSLAIHHRLALITSSRRELIELTHSEQIRSSPFFNIFANIGVTLFSEQEARDLIGRAVDESSIRFSENEVGELFAAAGYHPFFLQAACHFLFEAYTRKLDAAARRSFWVREFRAQAAPHLIEYWRHSEPREKLVLAALALMQGQELPASVRGRGWNTWQLEAVAARSERVAAHLEKRGLVIRRGELYAPFNTLFGKWIRDRLDDPENRIALDADGAPQTLVVALERAIAESGPAEPPPALPGGLTPREVQVLKLVATGLSDAQVAEQLVISPRTVSTHLQSIYGKLGINSRVAATRFAVENKLV